MALHQERWQSITYQRSPDSIKLEVDNQDPSDGSKVSATPAAGDQTGRSSLFRALIIIGSPMVPCGLDGVVKVG